MRKRRALLIVAVSIGILLLCYSLNVGVTIGSVWFGEKANEPWRMNNYYIIEGKYAYIFYGLTSLALGGLATGLSLPAFSSKVKSRKCLLALAAFSLLPLS